MRKNIQIDILYEAVVLTVGGHMVKQPIDKRGSLSSELAKLAPFRLFPQPVTEEQRKLRELEVALDDAIHANMTFFLSRRKDRT